MVRLNVLQNIKQLGINNYSTEVCIIVLYTDIYTKSVLGNPQNAFQSNVGYT
jgi:hypothetical protein